MNMSMMSPAATVAMMVAMMLPSFAPTLWAYSRQLRTRRTPRDGQRTTLFALGYASIWTAIGLALSALPALRVAPWALGTVVLCAGALQRSQWKARQLVRCRHVSVEARGVISAWRDGCRLGIDCGLSCVAPMAVLSVAGLMDIRVMVLVTAAITAERVTRAGARIARVTGGLALIAGLVLCLRG